jgi:mRNA interferase MazF
MAAPNRGDLVWIDFNPQARREQAGRRPAIVLSPRSYHQKTSYVIVCPITSTATGYPFAVPLPEGLPVSGVVLADQVKNLDRRVRRIEYAGRAPASVLAEVVARILPLLVSSAEDGQL